MNKSILISIRPEHVVKILNGEKTLELRKSVPTDFENIIKKHGGIWVNIYVTKAKPFVYTDYATNEDGYTYISGYGLTNLSYEPRILNGKVVARFWFDEFEKYTWFDGYGFSDGHGRYGAQKENGLIENIVDKLCLDEVEGIDEYGQGKDLFVWHIKQLEIFDDPKELKDFHYYKTKTVYSGMDCPPYVDEVKTTLTKAPRSWQYVWEKE